MGSVTEPLVARAELRPEELQGVEVKEVLSAPAKGCQPAIPKRARFDDSEDTDEQTDDECSVMLVTGVSLLLKSNSALGLYMMGVLSPSGTMRPFDTAADGMVWGEASGSLVLHSMPTNKDAYSTLVGTSANCNNALSPAGFVDPDMIQLAAETSLQDADLAPDYLAVCHPHGMGNPRSDLPELAGLEGLAE